MAKRNKRVFLSDTHISHFPEIPEGKYDYTWLRAEDADALANFLRYLNIRNDVEEVIFNGDLFDNWVVPVTIEPPSLDDIITSRKEKNDPVILALLCLCQNPNIRVVCLPGNHDMELTAEVVKKHFGNESNLQKPGMVFGGTHVWNAGSSVYRSSRLRAEHGSAHAMFNAPDPLNNPGSRLPLGYFISRVTATKTYLTGEPNSNWLTYVDDLLESVGPEKLAACVFESVLEAANLDLDAEIVLPKRNGRSASVTARQISQRYENLYDQWKQSVGAGLAFKSILAEIGYLGDAADRLCKKNDTRIVIFGHSHDWELDKDSWFVKDRVYANCGTWCGTFDKKPYTYVEVETSRDRKARKIRVHEWLGDGRNKVLKKANLEA